MFVAIINKIKFKNKKIKISTKIFHFQIHTQHLYTVHFKKDIKIKMSYNVK